MLKQDIKPRKKRNIELDADKLLEMARKSHEKYLVKLHNDDLNTAIDYYIKTLNANPMAVEAHYRLASLLWENGQITLETAIAQCNEAVNISPENPNAHLYLAYFYKVAGMLEDAEEETAPP